MLRALLLLQVAAVLALGPVASAQGRKPPLPPGRDPGGAAIALISTGVDYRLPSIARRLARDGEGELIGWDVQDRDRQPFDVDRGEARPDGIGEGTAIADFLLSASEARLVPMRVDADDPASLARAIAFVAHTPARVALVPTWTSRQVGLEPLQQALARFKDILIVAPVVAYTLQPPMLGLDNVLLVEAGGTEVPPGSDVPGPGGRTQRRPDQPQLAVVAAGSAAALLLTREPGLDIAALKRQLVESGGDALWRPRK